MVWRLRISATSWVVGPYFGRKRIRGYGLCAKVVSIRLEGGLTGYALFLLSTLVKRSQTTLHTASNTTVPLKRLKPRTETQAQLEARPARCLPIAPLSPSVDSDWPRSTKVRSAQAIHARTSQCERPTACLPPPGDDRRLDGPSVASGAARAGVSAPSARKSSAGTPSKRRGAGGSVETAGAWHAQRRRWKRCARP
jgi:hypothetical protein